MPATIKLRKPITGHTGKIAELTLRDPTYEDLMAVGAEPSTLVLTGNGSGFVQTDVDACSRYAQRLVQRDAVDVLHLLHVSDALAMHRAIVGFFQPEAEEATSPGTSPSQTNSSSG